MSTRAKMIISFLAGVIVTVVAFFVFAIIYAGSNNNKSSSNNENAEENVIEQEEEQNLEIFDEPKQEIKLKKLHVIQVSPDGGALASSDDMNDMDNYGVVVLFLPDDNTSYYDDMKIRVRPGERLMQIGTYRYETRLGIEKTVPVVKIMKK